MDRFKQELVQQGNLEPPSYVPDKRNLSQDLRPDLVITLGVSPLPGNLRVDRFKQELVQQGNLEPLSWVQDKCHLSLQDLTNLKWDLRSDLAITPGVSLLPGNLRVDRAKQVLVQKGHLELPSWVLDKCNYNRDLRSDLAITPGVSPLPWNLQLEKCLG